MELGALRKVKKLALCRNQLSGEERPNYSSTYLFFVTLRHAPDARPHCRSGKHLHSGLSTAPAVKPGLIDSQYTRVIDNVAVVAGCGASPDDADIILIDRPAWLFVADKLGVDNTAT